MKAKLETCILCDVQHQFMAAHLSVMHFNMRCPLCGEFNNWLEEHLKDHHPGIDCQALVHAFLLGTRPITPEDLK